MKKLVYLLILATFTVACSTEPQYVIKADIEGADDELFYLHRVVDGEIVIIDSAVSSKGSFKMKGSVDYPDLVQLVAWNKGTRVNFYLENAPLEIKGNIDSLDLALITGSKSQDEYQAFIEANNAIGEKGSAINQEYQVARQVNDTEKMAQYEKELVELEKELINLQKDFVRNNPSSYVAPAVLRSITYYLEADELSELANGFDAEVAEIPVVKEMKELGDAMKTVSVGRKAPDFTMNDVNGNPVSLSSRIGSKLLLIDFWAGWCAPCRQENPNLVKIYKQYNKKGFDIFGVSLDQSKDTWTSAIADDNITWTQVSDLQYWNNEAARLYMVRAIPANFLLDETGTIIGRNLRGDDLLIKVREILGE
ncbi:MAG TPA: TlpA disulfide reductase family protein [Bacteroidales bacterium]|nr:TlpA disulfide reductase family protein [Bacteroidales bacterium]